MTPPWVCLMYHDVMAELPRAVGGSAFFSVSASGFGRQLDTIRELGLRGASVAEVIARPQNAVGISFDDGDLGQATRAFPALAARGMSATFFVTTSWIGTANYASWDQLREMKAAGMSIQSHTHTHPFLSELDGAALRDELHRSRDLLNERLGQVTDMIALPGGDAPRRELRGVLAEEGFAVVATSRWGRNPVRRSGDGPLFVRRCTVRGEPDPRQFAAIVSGDWWLNLRKQTREQVLAFVRRSLGPTRYARLRRGVLDAARAP